MVIGISLCIECYALACTIADSLDELRCRMTVPVSSNQTANSPAQVNSIHYA